MTMNAAQNGTDIYMLGDSDDELERLKCQDDDVNEYTLDVISRLGIKPGSRVLDLACGPGFVSITHFSKLVGQNGCVVALDALEKWIKRIDSLKIRNITSICCKIEDANFQENEFDAIFCRYALWQFQDINSVIANIKKWLKPGGRFGTIESNITPMLHHPPVPGYDEIIKACVMNVELSGAHPWIGAQLPRLLKEAGLDIKYESVFIHHGGPESSFFRQYTGVSILKFYSSFVEKGLISKETLDTYVHGIEEMKANPHSRIYGFADVKFVAEN